VKPLPTRRTALRRISATMATGLFAALGATACSNSLATNSTGSTSWGGTSGPGTGASGGPQPHIPTRDSLLHPRGDYFGVSTFKTPSPSETAAVAEAAGRHPTILEYFLDWEQEFSAATVLECYAEGAVPLLTWEPSGSSDSANQPHYALRRITGGHFDGYVRRFAEGVRDQKWPVILRFAHEMNGNWYPWSEQNSGNHPGDYADAWRHVHRIFADVGADNVIWLWCPNVIRGTGDVELGPLYPGDDYVDWAGVDAYGFGEKTASEVLDPTVSVIEKMTQKPILIAETASQPGSEQPGWTADLFSWLGYHQRTIGFVWFNHSVAQGGKHDYRFTVDPKTQAAFRAGLSSLSLAHWPVADPPPSAG
jgi:hypothetical protein